MPTASHSAERTVVADDFLAAGFAARATVAAGRLLLDLRMQHENGLGPGGARLAQLGHTWSGLLLRNRIRARYPRDGVLTGPADRGPEALRRRRVWLVEPLDSTEEYHGPGDPDWSVRLALWERERGVVASAVAVPALAEVVCTADRDAARRRAARGPRQRPRVLVDTRNPAAFARTVVRQTGAELVPMGSAGAKTLAVVQGDADAYIHARGPWEWGDEALFRVAEAAGLQVTRLAREEVPPGPGGGAGPVALAVICRPPLTRTLLTAFAVHGFVSGGGPRARPMPSRAEP
ncbi:inositol monophosphatase family protein [Streptomyces sp. NPDC059070]|uniref:inositol monophosphatase family protein n=1 Tax=unclassified Streptomyces TaxID=2593676 RepID=UPI0034E201AB